MNWRLDLADHPLGAVQIIGGDPRLVAVWLSPCEVHFLDLARGALYGVLHIPDPGMAVRETEWSALATHLVAPNGMWLSAVPVGRSVLFSTHDGRMRLFCLDDGARVIMGVDGQLVSLMREERVVALAAAIDRELGTVALWRSDAVLGLFQQYAHMGEVRVDGHGRAEQAHLLMPDMAGTVILASGNRISRVEFSGQVIARLEVPEPIRVAALSPDGDLLATADRAGPSVRVYDANLNLIRQGNAEAILISARPLQSVTHVVRVVSVADSLDIDSDGTLVFAVGGTVCCTHIDDLETASRTQLLL